MDYFIRVNQAGTYNVEFRTAAESEIGAVQLQLIGENGNATIIEDFTFPSTGGWQTWTSTNKSVVLPAGELQLRVVITAPLFNINWFEFSFLTNVKEVKFADLQLFPNPSTNLFFVKGELETAQNMQLKVANLLGQTILEKDLGKTKAFQETVDLATFPNGQYLLTIQTADGAIYTDKIVKMRE